MESFIDFVGAVMETPAHAWDQASLYGGEASYVIPLLLTIIIWVAMPVLALWLIQRLWGTARHVIRRKRLACRTCGNSYVCCACQAEADADDEHQQTLEIDQ